MTTDDTIEDLVLPATAAEQLDTLRTAIGCDTVDVVRLTTHLDMWLDDEGMVVDQPVVNKAATILAHHFGYHSQLYFGPAVLTGGTDRNGELLPITASLADHIHTLLAPYTGQPHHRDT